MITFNIVLRKEKKLSNGDHTIYIRLTQNRKSTEVATDIRIKEDQWDKKLHKVKRHPNSVLLNNRTANALSKIQSLYYALQIKKADVSASEVKNAFQNKSQDQVMFLKYADEYIEELGKKNKFGTKDKFISAISKLKAYLKGKDISAESINVEFLKKYDAHLRDVKKNAVNTIHGNFRIIRKLLNDLIREGKLNVESNPFLRYKLSLEKTHKTFLNEDEVQRLANLDLSNNRLLDDVRNAFVFACYAGGLRVSDILQLKFKAFDGERIVVTTQKTKEVVQIKLPKICLEMISKYREKTKDEDSTVFPFLLSIRDFADAETLWKAISSKTVRLNVHLKTLARMAEINKNVTFHTSRHTWATLALRKGMRLEYVSKLMGHSSTKVTAIYAKIVNSDLDKAMEVFNE